MSKKNSLMCASPKGGECKIPEDFPITKCKPSRRGMQKHRTRPRKTGKILSWDTAESLAPDAKLSFDEQEKKKTRVIRRLTPEESAELALKRVVKAMNDKEL